MPTGLIPGQTNLSSFTIPTPGTTAPAQNKASLPDITSLLQTLNQLQISSQGQANVARLPGEANLEAQSSQNIGSELSGQLPQSVLTLLGQQAGERGIATGSPGSPNSNAAYLQALGLTSLGEQEQGQQDLTAATARNPVAQLLNPQNQLLTPYDAGDLALRGSGNQRGWLNDLQSLMPQPTNIGGAGRVPTQQPPPPDTSFYQWLYGGGDPTTTTIPGSSWGSPGSPGSPDLSSLLGPLNPDYNPSPENTVTTDQNSVYDPYAQYSDTSFLNTGFDPSLYDDTGGG